MDVSPRPWAQPAGPQELEQFCGWGADQWSGGVGVGWGWGLLAANEQTIPHLHALL